MTQDLGLSRLQVDGGAPESGLRVQYQGSGLGSGHDTGSGPLPLARGGAGIMV